MKRMLTMLAVLCAAAAAAQEEKAAEPGAPEGVKIEAVAPAEAKEAVPSEPVAAAAGEPAGAKEAVAAPEEPPVMRVDTSAPPPSADQGPKRTYMQEVGKKLTRALTNVARAGTELYVQPMEAKRVSGKSYSMIWPGAGEALGMGLTRLFGGIIEGATCVVPFPNGWQPLLEE